MLFYPSPAHCFPASKGSLGASKAPKVLLMALTHPPGAGFRGGRTPPEPASEKGRTPPEPASETHPPGAGFRFRQILPISRPDYHVGNRGFEVPPLRLPLGDH